jgi:putative membrane protein
MNITASILIIIVALLHLYFLVLEMFLWAKPLGLKTFKQSLEHANATKALAANQGLYNGFIAAGLLWSVWRGAVGHEGATFFLLCVMFAGVFGGFTVSRKILFVQALPGLIALITLWFLSP